MAGILVVIFDVLGLFAFEAAYKDSGSTRTGCTILGFIFWGIAVLISALFLC